MIKIVAKMNVKPECVDAFKAAAKELVEKSRAEEGNVAYGLHEQIGDPTKLAFIEIWRDQAAIDFHNATEHFTRILPALGEFCEGEGDIALFTELEL